SGDGGVEQNKRWPQICHAAEQFFNTFYHVDFFDGWNGKQQRRQTDGQRLGVSCQNGDVRNALSSHQKILPLLGYIELRGRYMELMSRQSRRNDRSFHL